MDLKESDLLGASVGKHWYYRAKGGAMQALLASGKVTSILDVGAGSGYFSRLLLEHGARDAMCVDPNYPAEHSETHAGKPLHFVRDVPEAVQADTVLLMDVLEHVDDDIGLLRLYVEKAAPGTRFLMTVPAFMWLWSGHDVFLEHRRRYTLPQLENVARAAGLRVQQGCYYYGLTLPLAAGTRVAGRLMGKRNDEPKSDMRTHSALVNWALGAICAAEWRIFRANRLAGLTAFCLAEKP